MKILLSMVFAVFLLMGCAANIEGVSNTNLFGKLPFNGTFAIHLVAGDPLIGKKIERMVVHQVVKQGYTYSESNPDLLVSFAFDVSPAGSISSAYTAINNAPRTSYVYGSTVYTNRSFSSATTYSRSTSIYDKNIVVRISDARTGDKLWEAKVSEQGWCNQIFVTAPSILSLMFENFPEDQTNINKSISNSDAVAKELINLFPKDTGWSCNKT